MCADELSSLGGIRHQSVKLVFGVFDERTHTHKAPRLLRFSFPPGTAGLRTASMSDIPTPTPSSPSTESVEKINAAVFTDLMEQEAFSEMEVRYLEIYFLIKASLARTRMQRVAYDWGADSDRDVASRAGEILHISILLPFISCSM